MAGSVVLHQRAVKIEFDPAWIVGGASGFQLRVKVPRAGEQKGFNLDLQLIVDSARSGASTLRAALVAHPEAVERARVAVPELLPAQQADAVADASDRTDLKSGKKPTL